MLGQKMKNKTSQFRPFLFGITVILSTLLVGCGGEEPTIGSLGGNPTPACIESGTNCVPEANAGSNQNVHVGTLVALSGGASSDLNSDPLTYSWTLDSAPGGSTATISTPTTVSASITPDLTGSYVVSLVVNDGFVDSAASSMTIAADNNTAPVASFAVSGTLPDMTGNLVTLDGSGSSDADLDTLTYSWTFTSVPTGSTAAFSSTTVVSPTFTPDVGGSYVVNLVVHDGIDPSTAATLTLSFTGGGSASDAHVVSIGTSLTAIPLASAGEAFFQLNAAANTLFTITATGSAGFDQDLYVYYNDGTYGTAHCRPFYIPDSLEKCWVANGGAAQNIFFKVLDGGTGTAGGTFDVSITPGYSITGTQPKNTFTSGRALGVGPVGATIKGRLSTVGTQNVYYELYDTASNQQTFTGNEFANACDTNIGAANSVAQCSFTLAATQGYEFWIYNSSTTADETYTLELIYP